MSCAHWSFLKDRYAVTTPHPHQQKASPSNLTVFSAEQIRIWRVDLHGFLCNPIYKPTEKKKIKHSDSRVHRVARSLPGKAAAARS